jgi:hypothetical protein
MTSDSPLVAQRAGKHPASPARTTLTSAAYSIIPGLRVMAASPRHIFAMKVLAARTRDIDDLRLLADIVGVESADAALQICANFYPDEHVSPRSAAVLRELFG